MKLNSITKRGVVLGVGVGLAAAVALPAPASAVKPTRAEKRLAKAECLVERGVTAADRLEFRLTYGGRRPIRRCVRILAREMAAERGVARAEAIQACRLERSADPIEFALDYPGPNPMRQCIRMEML